MNQNFSMFLVVGIAVAGSGLYDMKKIFKDLPATTNMAFIVVAPLLRDRKSMLTEIIQNFAGRPVHKVTKVTAIKPDHVYVIAENTLLGIRDHHLIPTTTPQEPANNTSINTFFASLALNFKDRAIGLVLGGMGQGAIEGAMAIEHHGGYVIINEPEDNKNGEMAAAVVKYNCPNIVLPLEQIADHLLSRVQ
jgi:chemotaxis response regulator CheB